MRSCSPWREQCLPAPTFLPLKNFVNTSALGNCENREGSSLLQSTLTNSVECLRGQDVVCYCQIHGVIFAGKRSTVHGHGLFVAVPLSLSGCFFGMTLNFGILFPVLMNYFQETRERTGKL